MPLHVHIDNPAPAASPWAPFIPLAAAVIGAILTLVIQAALAWRQRNWELTKMKLELFREEQMRRVRCLSEFEEVLHDLDSIVNAARDGMQREYIVLGSLLKGEAVKSTADEQQEIRNQLGEFHGRLEQIRSIAREYGRTPKGHGFNGQRLSDLLTSWISELMIYSLASNDPRPTTPEFKSTAEEARHIITDLIATLSTDAPCADLIESGRKLIRNLKSIEESILEDATSPSAGNIYRAEVSDSTALNELQGHIEALMAARNPPRTTPPANEPNPV